MKLELQKCKHGHFFFPSSDDIVGRSLRTYGEYSEGEVDFFRQILRPGDFALDIGANIGSLTIPMAHFVGREGRVWAFEPQPDLARLVAANAAINNVNVRVFNSAVGAEKSMVSIPDFEGYTQQYNYGRVSVGERGAWKNLIVPQTRLDDLDLPLPLRFAKIDVEGMEEDVLKGAKDTIANHLPILLVENDRKSKALALVKAVRDLGYTPFWHICMLFEESNFLKSTTNIFENQASFNMICAPPEGPNTLEFDIPLAEATEENTKMLIERSLSD
jgi:FkbM family methyltransferase